MSLTAEPCASYCTNIGPGVRDAASQIDEDRQSPPVEEQVVAFCRAIRVQDRNPGTGVLGGQLLDQSIVAVRQAEPEGPISAAINTREATILVGFIVFPFCAAAPENHPRIVNLLGLTNTSADRFCTAETGLDCQELRGRSEPRPESLPIADPGALA